MFIITAEQKTSASKDCQFFNTYSQQILVSFQHKDNAEAAIQDFSTIIRLSPDNPDGWIKRAEVQLNPQV